MTAPARLASATAAALLCTVVTGCGIPPTGPVDAGVPGTGILAPAEAGHPGVVYVYLIRDRRLVPVSRSTPDGGGPQAALDLLLAGPSPQDREKGLVTALPKALVSARVTPGSRVTRVDIPTAVPQPSELAIQQLVCTVSDAVKRGMAVPVPTAGPQPAPAQPPPVPVTVSAPGWRMEPQTCPPDAATP
ncbi:GerMN domain-containing protein [Yinghuangia seranimata]|uniref:GerMN domain-containing protein n=1 Tax=Yinghuangia seranimata TaxID=408067 RepID=UPI00248C90E4|nr:GerMN domain-containing protein [Yinghuangia seranimata]MDI2129472.1 GerMN domain-containing protein [Yinghuangia seranimata]